MTITTEPLPDTYWSTRQIAARWGCSQRAVRARLTRTDTRVRRWPYPESRRATLHCADDVRRLERRLDLTVNWEEQEHE